MNQKMKTHEFKGFRIIGSCSHLDSRNFPSKKSRNTAIDERILEKV